MHSPSPSVPSRNSLLNVAWQNDIIRNCVSWALYQTLQTTKMNLEKTVGLTSFQKPQLQSVSIFWKFKHPCLLFYLLCYLYLLFKFWTVSFMFHSLWWRFPSFEFRLILWLIVRSGKLPTYPSPKPTFCPKWEVKTKCWLKGGVGGQFPRNV